MNNGNFITILKTQVKKQNPFKYLQYILIGSPFTNFPNEIKKQEDQFISISKLLNYNGDASSSELQERIVVKGDSIAEISVCNARKFWITPVNVRINSICRWLHFYAFLFIGKHSFTEQYKN
jgi:hypothetical protein